MRKRERQRERDDSSKQVSCRALPRYQLRSCCRETKCTGDELSLLKMYKAQAADLLVGGAGLNGEHSCVGGRQGSIDGCQAVHVLWGVFQHAVSPISILSRVHRHGLKPTPTCSNGHCLRPLRFIDKLNSYKLITPCTVTWAVPHVIRLGCLAEACTNSLSISRFYLNLIQKKQNF